MKKILILNYEYPPLGGGAGVVSKEYAEGLVKLGNHVTVITTWFEGEPEIKEIGNLKIIRLKSLRKKSFQSNPIEMLSWAYKSIIFLKKYLKHYNFDLVIAFFSIPGGIVAKYIKDKFNIPYILSTHGHDIPGFFPEQMRKFHILTNWYTKKIWKKAEKILVLTTEMKKLADKFGNPNKNIILANGCYSEFFYPDVSKKKDMFTILFAGRLVIQKDPFTMLKAIKILKTKTSNFIVNIAGDGPMKKEIELYIKQNNLSENIKFTGWLTKEEIRDYYQSSHIQICTSKVEAMSVAILESLYSGLYILSTPISGNTDMIVEGKTGEFFNIGDYKTLGNKLIDISEIYRDKKHDNKIIEQLKDKYNRENIIFELNNITKNVIKNLTHNG
ncbi:MAG: glycosyltransferase family 4 protein [Candidatus Gracilibacteria bacterium]|nr:glycosyltransferase family 4 protein [Candidatus Gracilibacteria bacterium]